MLLEKKGILGATPAGNSKFFPALLSGPVHHGEEFHTNGYLSPSLYELTNLDVSFSVCGFIDRLVD